MLNASPSGCQAVVCELPLRRGELR